MFLDFEIRHDLIKMFNDDLTTSADSATSCYVLIELCECKNTIFSNIVCIVF